MWLDQTAWPWNRNKGRNAGGLVETFWKLNKKPFGELYKKQSKTTCSQTSFWEQE